MYQTKQKNAFDEASCDVKSSSVNILTSAVCDSFLGLVTQISTLKLQFSATHRVTCLYIKAVILVSPQHYDIITRFTIKTDKQTNYSPG